MEDTCIVCLGDLRIFSENAEADSTHDDAKTQASGLPKSIQDDTETIAHLLPCKHDLHNSCLKPWVERANSCPICRSVFNEVQLSATVGGPLVESYAVQDKVQQAEIDPTMVVEDELFAVEAWDPCMVCGTYSDGHGVMYCDGCGRTAHTFCAGFDDGPDIWYCEACLPDFDHGTTAGASASRQSRSQRRTRRSRGRVLPNNDATWARVWQEVSRQVDLDLDFPFDDEQPLQPRTEEQRREERREVRRWQRRFEVASRHSAADRLRDIARLQSVPQPKPEPESQEELRAWNAFDKARESQEAPANIRRRKRRANASPTPIPEEDQADQPVLKRPRLRRPIVFNEQPESSSIAARRNADEPTFLSSLLREVENKPISAGSPSASDFIHGPFSPQNSSPMRSPASSEPGTPRAATPPPLRPSSPPLSSTIVPVFVRDNATFSPFSPTEKEHTDNARDVRHRGRQHHARHTDFRDKDKDDGRGADLGDRASSSSPSRALSYSAKQEIQRMVKLALGTRYRDKEITKEEYTDINKDVSRKLYSLVVDASALADQVARESWQNVANDEVQKAVGALASKSDSADGEASV